MKDSIILSYVDIYGDIISKYNTNNIKEINKALCTIGRNKDEPKIAITKEVCRILKNICSKTSI